MLVICTPQMSWLEIEKGRRNSISAKKMQNEQFTCGPTMMMNERKSEDILNSTLTLYDRWHRRQPVGKKISQLLSSKPAEAENQRNERSDSHEYWQHWRAGEVMVALFVHLFLIYWLHRVKVKPVFLYVRIRHTRSAGFPASWGRLLSWICCN